MQNAAAAAAAGIAQGPPRRAPGIVPSSFVANLASGNAPSSDGSLPLFGGAAPWIGPVPGSSFSPFYMRNGLESPAPSQGALPYPIVPRGAGVPSVPGVPGSPGGGLPYPPVSAEAGFSNVPGMQQGNEVRGGSMSSPKSGFKLGSNSFVQKPLNLRRPSNDRVRTAGSTSGQSGTSESRLAIPDLNIEVSLPAWFKETEDELDRRAPTWPENFGGAPEGEAHEKQDENEEAGEESFKATDAAPDATESGVADRPETPFWLKKTEKASRANRRLTRTIFAVFFATSVERTAMKHLDEWAKRMRAQFEESLELQMRSCVSWLFRALRTFCSTLLTDSHAGLVIAPDLPDKPSKPWRGLPAAKRLAIRVGVLLDLLEAEAPPEPMRRFLHRMAAPEETSLHLPFGYLTDKETEQLSPNSRGGIYATPGSYEHELLVVGFVFLRGLLANLLSSWSRSLIADGTHGARRAKHNLQAVATVVFEGMKHRYSNVGDATKVVGLVAAIGTPASQPSRTRDDASTTIPADDATSASATTAAKTARTSVATSQSVDPELVSTVSERLGKLARSTLGVETDTVEELPQDEADPTSDELPVVAEASEQGSGEEDAGAAADAEAVPPTDGDADIPGSVPEPVVAETAEVPAPSENPADPPVLPGVTPAQAPPP